MTKQVRIYHSGECVATHMRSYRHNDYTYVEEHLPPKSREYHACVSGFKTRYWSILKLMEDLAMAKVERQEKKLFEKIASYDLLIIDDFGIKKFNNEQILDLMEIIEDRHGRKATVIASQIPVSDWYDCLETNTTAADAILDRMVHSAIRFELKGDSLRKNH